MHTRHLQRATPYTPIIYSGRLCTRPSFTAGNSVYAHHLQRATRYMPLIYIGQPGIRPTFTAGNPVNAHHLHRATHQHQYLRPHSRWRLSLKQKSKGQHGYIKHADWGRQHHYYINCMHYVMNMYIDANMGAQKGNIESNWWTRSFYGRLLMCYDKKVVIQNNKALMLISE